MDKDGTKLIARNKKAYHTYEIFDKWEAGIELKGMRSRAFATARCRWPTATPDSTATSFSS